MLYKFLNAFKRGIDKNEFNIKYESLMKQIE